MLSRAHLCARSAVCDDVCDRVPQQQTRVPTSSSPSWQLKVRERLRPGYSLVRMWLLSASVVAALLLAGGLRRPDDHSARQRRLEEALRALHTRGWAHVARLTMLLPFTRCPLGLLPGPVHAAGRGQAGR
jgi:hypothetical protein